MEPSENEIFLGDEEASSGSTGTKTYIPYDTIQINANDNGTELIVIIVFSAILSLVFLGMLIAYYFMQKSEKETELVRQ